MNERIITLAPRDAPDAFRLSTAAGWNQSECDWRRVMELEPDGCFGLIADDRLVATATTTCYGRELAWIGMVLTDPAYRGRGFARALMEQSLEYLERRRVAWIKLDATDMGRPLYAHLGFEDETPIERWKLSEAPRWGSPSGLRPGFGPASAKFHLDRALDRQAFGADRAALIEKLSEIEAASSGSGYALGRPGRVAQFFGPCVARDYDDVRRLVSWFLGRHPGEPVYWDLLPENRGARRIAEEFGFERQRQLVRMVKRGPGEPAPFTHNDCCIYAIAGFEYG